MPLHASGSRTHASAPSGCSRGGYVKVNEVLTLPAKHKAAKVASLHGAAVPAAYLQSMNWGERGLDRPSRAILGGFFLFVSSALG